MRAAHANEDERSGLGDLQRLHVHQRRFRLGVIVRESAEVVHADEERGSFPHRADVERLLDPPDERLAECGPAPRDLVDVAARHGVVARVEAVRHLVDGDDVDVGGQLVVQFSPQLLRGWPPCRGRGARPARWRERRRRSAPTHTARTPAAGTLRESPGRSLPGPCGRSSGSASPSSGCRRIRSAA